MTIRIQTAKTCTVCDRLIGAGEFPDHLVNEHEEELREEWRTGEYEVSRHDLEQLIDHFTDRDR